MNYDKLLEEKRLVYHGSGFKINSNDINPVLFPFQNDLTRYAVIKGRSATFADTGLGKTPMQIEWARIMYEYTNVPVLIVAPLSVAWQTIDDTKELLGIEVKYLEDDDTPLSEINITNYERINKFNPSNFSAIALDESSILKALTSKTRKLLTDMFANTKYKSCYTATPSPNDITEIGNHAEFLGIMSAAEMKATFFMNRENKITKEKWQIKGHAKNKFYKWLASWGMAIRKPSDLGYEDDGFVLPELNIIPHFIDTGYKPNGALFAYGLGGLSDRREVRRETIEQRCKFAADIANQSTEQFVVWTYLNDEAYLMHNLIPDSINVEGKDNAEFKANTFRDFKNKRFRVLITKPKIAAFGMNFQQSHNMIFVGLDDSMESLYQCIRRQYRFMQTHDVNAHIVLAKAQRAILENVNRKEENMRKMQKNLIENSAQYAMEELGKIPASGKFIYNPQVKFELPSFVTIQ